MLTRCPRRRSISARSLLRRAASTASLHDSTRQASPISITPAARFPPRASCTAHNELLDSVVYGNPHADHAPIETQHRSARRRPRTPAVAPRRRSGWSMSSASPANATGAVKLVGESYPFGPSGAYVLSADNHNSLNGVREYARRAAAQRRVRAAGRGASSRGRRRRRFHGSAPHADRSSSASRRSRTLAAFGILSTSSTLAHGAGFDVLLDAAAFLPSVCAEPAHAPARIRRAVLL